MNTLSGGIISFTFDFNEERKIYYSTPWWLDLNFPALRPGYTFIKVYTFSCYGSILSSCIPFNKYILSAYYMSGTFLAPGEPCLQGTYILEGKYSKKINMYVR